MASKEKKFQAKNFFSKNFHDFFNFFLFRKLLKKIGKKEFKMIILDAKWNVFKEKIMKF